MAGKGLGGANRGVTITVDGLTELRKGLGKIGPDARKELTKGMRAIAKDTGAGVRQRMRADFTNPRRRGDKVRATSAVTHGVSGTTAYVGYHSRNRYVGWLDFGGTLGKVGGRRNSQYRPMVRPGRYLYPAIFEARKRNLDAVSRLVDGLLEKHI